MGDLPERSEPGQSLQRLSDADRQRVVDQLRVHTGEGRLTLDEFSDRVALVFEARTVADLEPVVGDLPVPVRAPTEPAAPRTDRRDRVLAVMGAEARKGRWRVRRRTTAVALMGGAVLDLRGAVLEHPEVEIRCWALMGSVAVLVPEGIPVDFGGFVLMGAQGSRVADVDPLPGAPTIRVRARGLWGTVVVKSRKPRGEAAGELGPGSRGRGQRHRDRQERFAERDRRRAARYGADRPRPEPEAGTVTMLATDIVGSTRLAEALGDQGWIELLREHNALVRGQIERHGGTEVKQSGDGFLATFSSARAAVRAGLAIHDALERYRVEHPGTPLELRIGVHAGEVETADGDIYGVNVSTAFRLADAAAGGEVLVSGVVADLADSTSDLRFGSAKEIEVAGRSLPLRVHTAANG